MSTASGGKSLQDHGMSLNRQANMKSKTMIRKREFKPGAKTKLAKCMFCENVMLCEERVRLGLWLCCEYPDIGDFRRVQATDASLFERVDIEQLKVIYKRIHSDPQFTQASRMIHGLILAKGGYN